MTVLPDPGRSRAVLIGASTYAHLDDLPAVHNNLAGFRDVLVDPALGGLPADSCTIVEEPPSGRDVYRALREAATAVDDTLLVYFAGHGRLGTRNELFLCMPDTDPDELYFSTLPYDQLREAVADSRATKKVVILDCCFSGRALADLAGHEETIVGQVGIKGTYILTATAANAVALAPSGEQYTAFTGTLLNLLENGIADGPELLTFAEIFPHLKYALTERRLPEPRQQGSDTIAQLALTRNLAYRPQGNTAPAPRGGFPTTLARDWAICCSGGGIRTAAYCLGALQNLDQGGLVERARWILGVSGGGYIASSRALVAHDLPDGAEPQAYAPGAPEERNLRHNTRYLASAPPMLGATLPLLLGAICTFVIVLAPLYSLAHAWGWLLRDQSALVPSGPHVLTSTVSGVDWWLPSVIAAGITLLFLSWRWLQPDDRHRGANRASLVRRSATVTVALALAMLAVPPLISWLTESSGSFGMVARALGFGTRSAWSFAVVAGLVAAVAEVARYVHAGLAKWDSLGGVVKSATAGQPGLLTGLVGWLRQRLLLWLASAVIVLVGVLFALLWISDGARAGFSGGQLLTVGVALAVTLIARVVVNVDRLSMQDLHHRRLADAFAVTRQAVQEPNPGRARALFAVAAATPLSTLRDRRAVEPGLVICATANISAEREVPPGRYGFCVAFDPEHVTLRRGTGRDAQARTSDYEALVGGRGTTLLDVSAISGEAVSPLVSAATRCAYRILFTATNVRLGVWLPHPNLVREARERIDHPDNYPASTWWERHPLLLLLWYLTPHLMWGRDPGQNIDREARLWAHVLGLRLVGKRSGALWYRVMLPTLGLLWARAAGRLSYRATWMYVTDGGHYDNLGLVEALRRGASNIVVLDASGDYADTWFALGGAIALARTDAGVQIDLDPTTMVKGGNGLAPGQMVRPWAHGRFHRPQPVPGLPDEGEILVCKAGWWVGAPWEVLEYARHYPSYPGGGSLENLYDAAEFEAYQQLGAAAVLAAVRSSPTIRLPIMKVPSGLTSMITPPPARLPSPLRLPAARANQPGYLAGRD